MLRSGLSRGCNFYTLDQGLGKEARMDYLDFMKEKIGEANDGISEYASQLEDLCGLVLDPIGEMIEATENGLYEIPYDVDPDVVVSYLNAASDGAEHYAEELYDTTDCTEHLDELMEYLGLEYDV